MTVVAIVASGFRWFGFTLGGDGGGDSSGGGGGSGGGRGRGAKDFTMASSVLR